MKAQVYAQTIVELQNRREQIRNISVIAHVDHGKTTLVDSLLSKAGLINQEEAGKKRLMDTKQEEIDRGITIKSTGISLVFNENQKDYLVNLVDSPGHVDFSSEVTAALRITDGALVVVDCVEGVCVQTEMVTRQAMTEQIKPVLHINKVDRGIMELQLSPEDLYQKLNHVIEDVNAIFAKFEDEHLGDVNVDPTRGNVSFGSGKQGWAITMPQIAKRLAKKGGDEAKILKRLWGDHFYDPQTKHYVTSPITPDGRRLERFVCQVVFKPLIRLFHLVRDGDLETIFNQILPAIDVQLATKDKDLVGNDLLVKILQAWIPAGDALLSLIVNHLPSPVEAQKYRVDKLYTGPLDDPVATAIRNCDPEGPLTVFISKMVPSNDGNRFFAFGRIFSGTIRPKTDIIVMNSDHIVGTSVPKKSKISRLVLMMGKTIENVESVPCGNNVGIAGLEAVLVKSGTVATLPETYPISPMKFSVSPVVRRALTLENVANLGTFVKALKKLVHSDPCLEVVQEASGECIIAGAGELHIDVCLTDLQEFLGDSIKFKVSPPVVKFTETVLKPSSQPCLGKSANKLNRVYVTAEPLNPALVDDLENKKTTLENMAEFTKSLAKDYGWDKSETIKLWWFEGTCCLVDMSHAVPYLSSVKDHLINACKQVCAEGILAGEPLRGVRFNVVDAMLHSDNVHRSSGQIIPAARRAFLGAQLCATPTLVEPYFLAEIQSDQKVLSKIYSLIFKKRGSVIEEVPKEGSDLVVLRSYLPVLKSFGFDSKLREETSGHATPQLLFSHWKALPGDVNEEGSLVRKQVDKVRLRKKMKPTMPILADYCDKL